MTRLTKIDTLSYLIKEPKPVTPVQVPNNMRVSEIVFRSQTGRAYYPTEPSRVGGGRGLGEAAKKMKKEKKGGEESNITCKLVNSKASFFLEKNQLPCFQPDTFPESSPVRGRSGIFMSFLYIFFQRGEMLAGIRPLLCSKIILNPK